MDKRFPIFPTHSQNSSDGWKSPYFTKERSETRTSSDGFAKSSFSSSYSTFFDKYDGTASSPARNSIQAAFQQWKGSQPKQTQSRWSAEPPRPSSREPEDPLLQLSAYGYADLSSYVDSSASPSPSVSDIPPSSAVSFQKEIPPEMSATEPSSPVNVLSTDATEMSPAPDIHQLSPEELMTNSSGEVTTLVSVERNGNTSDSAPLLGQVRREENSEAIAERSPDHRPATAAVDSPAFSLTTPSSLSAEPDIAATLQSDTEKSDQVGGKVVVDEPSENTLVESLQSPPASPNEVGDRNSADDFLAVGEDREEKDSPSQPKNEHWQEIPALSPIAKLAPSSLSPFDEEFTSSPPREEEVKFTSREVVVESDLGTADPSGNGLPPELTEDPSSDFTGIASSQINSPPPEQSATPQSSPGSPNGSAHSDSMQARRSAILLQSAFRRLLAYRYAKKQCSRQEHEPPSSPEHSQPVRKANQEIEMLVPEETSTVIPDSVCVTNLETTSPDVIDKASLMASPEWNERPQRIIAKLSPEINSAPSSPCPTPNSPQPRPSIDVWERQFSEHMTMEPIEDPKLTETERAPSCTISPSDEGAKTVHESSPSLSPIRGRWSPSPEHQSPASDHGSEISNSSVQEPSSLWSETAEKDMPPGTTVRKISARDREVVLSNDLRKLLKQNPPLPSSKLFTAKVRDIVHRKCVPTLILNSNQWDRIRSRKFAPALHRKNKVQRTVYRKTPSRFLTEEEEEREAYLC